jgi:HPt (histidine-containing phosphotransfer) domain-containing protein
MGRVAGFVEYVENPGRSRAGGPIDREHLARQCLHDPNLEVEVLRLFDETIARYMERLSSAREPEEIRMNLHVIKGAAAGIGAFAVADTARQAEDMLREGWPVEGEPIEDLAMAIEEVRGYIARLVARAGE